MSFVSVYVAWVFLDRLNVDAICQAVQFLRGCLLNFDLAREPPPSEVLDASVVIY